MTRNDSKLAFLRRAGWSDAHRTPLAGDASDRSYERLVMPEGRAVLMDAPPGRGDDPADFIAIARHLLGLNLSAPRILADDLANGFLLLEDLGDGIYARLIAADPTQELPLYAEAVGVLAHLQSRPAPVGLPELTAADWAEAAGFATDWYAFAITGHRPDRTAFTNCLADLLTQHADGPRVLILRDYHAENLLWLPERAGLARVGLLDFQLAQMGQPGYDLVSLLQDARRDIVLSTEAAMIRHFLTLTGQEQARFIPAYAVLGAQRALRILGIFARLCLVAGKPSYLKLMPRVWDQLRRNLAHPALAPLRTICDSLLPAPTPANMARIETQCAKHLMP